MYILYLPSLNLNLKLVRMFCQSDWRRSIKDIASPLSLFRMSTSIVIHPISVAGVRFPLAVRSTAPNIRDLDIDISVGECVGCESYYGINLNWIRWFSQQLRSIFGIKVNVVRACKFLHKIYTKVHAQICAGLRANGWGSNFFKIKSFESFADKIFYRGKSVTDAFRQYTEHSQHHEFTI